MNDLDFPDFALPTADRIAQLRYRIHQLILMRETGPKRAGWHQARMRLIWRLHEELDRVMREQREELPG
jgi:hypothetical protein